MSINIKGTQLTLTDTLEAYVFKRLAAIEKLTKGRTRTIFDIELAKLTNHHRKGDVYYAEINLELDGTLFRASEEAETVEAAIDAVKDELMRELRKEKTRLTSKARRDALKAKRVMKGEGE